MYLEGWIYYCLGRIAELFPKNYISDEWLLWYCRELDSVWTSLSLLWITYWVLGLLLPRSHAVSRPIAQLNDQKIIRTLMRNTLIVMAWGPITAAIPPILPVYTWTKNILPFYGCSLTSLIASLVNYFCVAVFADGWFYYTHRLLHHRKLYRYHRQHHEFIQSHALSGLYCGALEMWLVNNLSVSLPMRLFGLSRTEMMVGSILTALNVIKGHGGLQKHYNLPSWLIADDEHAKHHKEMNVNYGVMYFFDGIHGTYTPE